MKKKMIVLCVLGMFLLSSLSTFSVIGLESPIVNGETMILRDDDGTMEDRVRLDYGDDMAVKYFEIPLNINLRIKSARLYIYGKAFGINKPVDSHIIEDVYGDKIIIFNPFDYFSTNEYNWVVFDIPKESLTFGSIYFIIADIYSVDNEEIKGWENNNLFVGIDTDNDNDRSGWLDDGSHPPLPEFCNGELMIYLELTLTTGRIRILNNYVFERFLNIFSILSQILG